MIRSRVAKFVAVVASALVVATCVVSTRAWHDDDDDVLPDTAGGPVARRVEAVALPSGLIGLELHLGLKDDEPTEWTGDVAVSEGRVVAIDVMRDGPNPEVNGSRFRLGTNKAAMKAALKKKKQQLKKLALAAAGPLMLVSLDAPPTATVTVRTSAGNFDFRLSDLAPGTRAVFLDGEAAVERQSAAVRLTGPRIEDDYPVSAPGADGAVWLASVEYEPEQPVLGQIGRKKFAQLVPTRHGDRIVLRKFAKGTWQKPIDVTAGGLDVWRPAVAVDGDGVVWVAWAMPVDGDWEIFRRGYTPPGPGQDDGKWTETQRVTQAQGSDFHVVATTDARGTVWLAWQAWRGDNYEILVSALREGHAWSTPKAISSSPADDWGPAIAADAKGNVFVGWDTYDRGNYDVLLGVIAPTGDPKIVRVADSARFEARPHLAVDPSGRVWIAYEEGDEQWGKDYSHAGPVENVGLKKNPGFALYVNRTVRVKCFADEALSEPKGSLEAACKGTLNRGKSVPRLAIDADGGVWLALRHHPMPGGAGEVWSSFTMRYEGDSWSTPRRLPFSANLMDNRPALSASGRGLLAVYSGDRRASTQSRRDDDLYAAYLLPERSETRPPVLVAGRAAPAADLATVHPDELADIAARARAYRIEAGGKTLRLMRGEFHRHTEFSSHNDQDGLLEDTWRYALDAGRLDWMGNGDHDNGFGHEYMWWLIQKNTDLHHNAPHFIPAQTYERSVVFPNGHRNVMMPKRGIRPLPRGNMAGTLDEGTPDTKVLYDYLKHFGGICASHTSATQMGTDWRDNDPEVEPVVEIYQGHRHNYEHFGAPKSPTPETQIGGYEPSGFVWNALQKGYKLGFESSSDHVSTHLSYAVVLAEEVSRQGIIDAFKKRHCYAATDNIILDVRSGDHLMGDTFDAPGKPEFAIVAIGTKALAKVHVIRDNKYVFSTEPNDREVKLKYTDEDAKPGETHYYYVRIEQSDGNLAWASPMWVRVTP